MKCQARNPNPKTKKSFVSLLLSPQKKNKKTQYHLSSSLTTVQMRVNLATLPATTKKARMTSMTSSWAMQRAEKMV